MYIFNTGCQNILLKRQGAYNEKTCGRRGRPKLFAVHPSLTRVLDYKCYTDLFDDVNPYRRMWLFRERYGVRFKRSINYHRENRRRARRSIQIMCVKTCNCDHSCIPLYLICVILF